MAITGLDRRVAFGVVSLIGTSRGRILVGIITVMALLAFFIPTASARVACLTPIALGMISALGIDKKSRVAGMLMMAIAYLSMIWAMGVATGAAQNVYVNALMERTIHVRISWIDWLVVGAPFSAALSVVLYFVLSPFTTQALQNFKTVRGRHAQVQQNDVGIKLVKDPFHLARVRHSLDLGLVIRQVGREELDVGRLVVDDQNASVHDARGL